MRNSPILMIPVVVLIATSAVHGGLVASWSAEADSNGNTVWEDSVNSNDLNFYSVENDDTAGTPERVAASGRFAYAFSFPSTETTPAIGASTSTEDGTGKNAHLQAVDAIMTIDVWFKVDTTSQKAVLFSTGGFGRGVSLNYDNGQLRLLVKGTGAADGPAEINLTAAIAADETTDFVRATVTIDSGSASETVRIYVDNDEIANSSTVMGANFTGNSSTSIGMTRSDILGGADRDNNPVGADDENTWDASFAGDIAQVQIYDVVAPPAQIVADWSADADSNGNTVWEDSVSTNDLNFYAVENDDTAGTPERVIASGDFTHAFSFPSTESTPAIGASTSVGAGGTDKNAYLQTVDAAMTIAVWFKADTTSQKAVLFSTGGLARGISLSYDNGKIRFLLKSTGSKTGDAEINLSSGIGSGGTKDFVHAVATVDRNGINETACLYINGWNVAQTSAAISADNFTGDSSTSIGMTRSDVIGGADSDGGGSSADDDSDSWSDGFSGDIARIQIFDGVEPPDLASPRGTMFSFQ